ncbi:MAG: glycosyltransferase family 4 protein, partial [Gemmatimonadaceae bacterium]
MALCVPDETTTDVGVVALQSLQVIVAAHDAKMAGEFERMVAEQRLMSARIVYPVARAVRDAIDGKMHVLFVAEGTQLLPNTLESAWWTLETRPDIAFVAFGDERGPRTPMLEAIANCVVLRNTAVVESAANSDRRWPGIAPIFGAMEQGKRGHLIREPLVVRSAAMKETDAPVVRAVAELRAKGLSDAVLGDSGHDAPPPMEPLQQLDERTSPTSKSAVHSLRIVGKGKYRVLALLQGFPMGGYSAFNADFLPRLVSGGHSLTVCTTELWRSEWRLENVRSATRDVVHAGGVVALESMPRYISYLIESRGIEVVLVSHTMAGYRLLPWLRRRHPDTAFVDYVHTDWFEKNMYGSYGTMAAAHAEWLDAQVASSQTLARELVRRGSNADTMHAVTINLDVTDWDPARFRSGEVRKSLGCRNGQPLVLFAGRLSEEKRPLLAVECWRALIAAGVDARFAVAGNGPLLSQMVEAVETAGLKDRVEFLGELDGDMLRFVYSAADVYHAPSEIEGIARSLYEAMAMQCVPVVADVG